MTRLVPQVRSSCGIGTTMHPCPPRPLLHLLCSRHSRIHAQRCLSVKYRGVFALFAPCGQGAPLPQSGGFAGGADPAKSAVDPVSWSHSKLHTNF
jgi:hypothetical protein